MGMLFDVHRFHSKFGLVELYAKTPSLDNVELLKFRAKFLEEEAQEFGEALDKKDLVGAFDALIDIVYVALGTALMMNVPWIKGWNIVHAANMRKQRAKYASESKRLSKYDVVKPIGWVPPDRGLEALVLQHEYACKLGCADHCGSDELRS